MNRRNLDRLIPLVYGVLVVVSAVFFPVALAGIAVIGAIGVGAYFSVVRHMLPRPPGEPEHGYQDYYDEFTDPDLARRSDPPPPPNHEL